MAAGLRAGRSVGALVREVAAAGTTVLLVDQNAHFALQVADRGYVLEKGRVVLSGRADELLADERTLRRLLVL
jgi:branched-chain amino acid transport system ATP-binding protein